jgi:hypothetical protein
MYFPTLLVSVLPALAAAGILDRFVPPSPHCGPNAQVANATCESSPYGPCCSTSGFCELQHNRVELLAVLTMCRWSRCCVLRCGQLYKRTYVSLDLPSSSFCGKYSLTKLNGNRMCRSFRDSYKEWILWTFVQQLDLRRS